MNTERCYCILALQNSYVTVTYITVTQIIREQRSMNKILISSKREFLYRSSTKVKETQSHLVILYSTPSPIWHMRQSPGQTLI